MKNCKNKYMYKQNNIVQWYLSNWDNIIVKFGDHTTYSDKIVREKFKKLGHQRTYSDKIVQEKHIKSGEQTTYSDKIFQVKNI